MHNMPNGEVGRGLESTGTVEESSPMVQGLLQRKEGIDKELPRLNQEIDALTEQKARLEKTLLHIQELLKLEGYMSPAEEKQVTDLLLRSDLLHVVATNSADQVFAHLSDAGQPIHYKVLSQQLLSKGVTIPGRDPAATLLSQIYRDARFKRFGRGTYGLASWKSTKTSKKRRRSRRERKRKAAR